MRAALALARIPLCRLLRTPRAWASIGGWALVGIVAAAVVRASGQTSGADHVMRGTYGTFVVPLLAYAVVGAGIGGGMRKGIRGVVGLGASAVRAALATTLVATVGSALTLAVLSPAVCAIAHGSSDPPLVADMIASAWIGALGGAAYATYFAAGAAIGTGSARGVFLAADFVLGAGSGVSALLTPRGHLISLLGGPRCADLGARTSSIVLVVLCLLYLGVMALLSRRST